MGKQGETVPESFVALRSHADGKTVRSVLEEVRLADLSAGELVVRTRFAGVNYKDCLAVTGQARIIESFPRIAGIELVGEVVASDSDAFAPGTTVMAHGFKTGIAFDGGFSPWARLPADHAMALPATLDARQCAMLGVPGFTVALCLDRFEQLGVSPSKGPIAVDGATGAVGVLAVAILARAGYSVTALTRKPGQEAALLALGASEVMLTDSLLASTKALEHERFAAAIDNVGGPLLSGLLKSMCVDGCIASVGNASGNDYPGSVLPFIMRRVQMFGIVANVDWPLRRRLWARLAGEWRPDFEALTPHLNEIALSELATHCERQTAGKAAGRTVVGYM